ncbi:MAG: hypothetical protein MJ168_10895 [Clostridia bacterium]|nr:hypothetical protein [Clostridia bacterium]
MAVSLQDRYGSLVDAKLRYTIVQKVGSVWNNKYEGNPKAGAVKIPVRDTEATVAAYSKTAGAAKTFTNGSFATLNITKDYAVNEVIDNYDVASVPDNIVADRVDSAGYSLALQINTDATAALIDGGTESSDTAALTKTTVYDAIVDARTALSTAKVPAQGRYILVTPTVMALLIKSPEFIAASNLGDEVKESGAVGRIAGFTVFEDATLAGIKSKATNDVEFIAGHPDWCCRVEEWAVEPHVQDLNGSGDYIGACAVQGRKIYDHMVTKAAAVYIKAHA